MKDKFLVFPKPCLKQCVLTFRGSPRSYENPPDQKILSSIGAHEVIIYKCGMEHPAGSCSKTSIWNAGYGNV